mgnify:CR=1 FL=1
MATNLFDHNAVQTWFTSATKFTSEERLRLLDDDLEAGRNVSRILASIVVLGTLLMIGTVLYIVL